MFAGDAGITILFEVLKRSDKTVVDKCTCRFGRTFFVCGFWAISREIIAFVSASALQ